MLPEMAPTAEGDLARTPLSHLLVYALDRRLTGALFLQEVTGVLHTVRLARGEPAKVRPGDGYAMLGQMLVAAGAIDEATLEAALGTRGLLGDVLLLTGRVEPDFLRCTIERQFYNRMVRLFGLGPETRYLYYDGHGELEEWGGEASSADPLAVLWAGLARYGEVSTMFDATLARLGQTVLRLHPLATPERFGFGEDEQLVIESLRGRPAALPVLVAAGVAPEPVVRRVAYALVIARQLELEGLAPPAGCEEPNATSASGQPLGKMRLRAAVHREGAAAPDAPGDGERAPVVPRERRRARRSYSHHPARMGVASPAVTETSEPVSEPSSAPSSSAPAQGEAPASASSAPEPADHPSARPSDPGGRARRKRNLLSRLFNKT